MKIEIVEAAAVDWRFGVAVLIGVCVEGLLGVRASFLYFKQNPLHELFPILGSFFYQIRLGRVILQHDGGSILLGL